MFRKSVVLLLALVLIISCQMSFAGSTHPVSADQIIIEEPGSEKINNEKQVYVTVNIVSNKLKDRPLTVSLVRIENNLPFAELLSSDLKVSVMNLKTSAAGELDRSTKFNLTYDTSAKQYSDDYKKETQLINRFYELKDLINKTSGTIDTLNKKYKFESIVGNSEEVSKLSSEVHSLYKKWLGLRTTLSDYKKEYDKLQIEYVQYFEKQIFTDEINIPSYSKVVGKLANGHYLLRFIDDDKQLIKEFEFDVIDNQEIIKVIPISGNK